MRNLSVTGVQGYRSSRAQEFRSTGVQEYSIIPEVW